MLNAISDEFCKQIIEEYDDSDDWKWYHILQKIISTINDYDR